jgi:head-tail adaptor
MEQAELKALVARVRAGLRITKVVATRSVKGQRGDTFAGFSAAWNTVQEDGGQGVISAGEETDEAQSLTGMTLQEAIVASCLLGREADTAAYRNAAASGNISKEHSDSAIRAIRANYSKLIVEALGTPGAQEPNGSHSK